MVFRCMFAFLLPLALPAEALAFELTIVTQAPALAPFQLVSASPYDRQTVQPGPAHYVLRFSQPVRPDKSYIKVMDMYGMRVDDARLESDGMTLTAALPALSPGRYTVKWMAQCQCPDTVVLNETFHFTVK